MIIRAIAPTDAESIHAIHGLCLQRSLSGRYTREQIEAWMAGRTPQGTLRAAEGGERFFVTEEAGAIAGYASWKEEELLSLFVHPDFQGRGIGSMLLAACFDDAARSDASISVVKSVLGAEGFYARHGFGVVGPGSMSKRGVAIPHIWMRRGAGEAAGDEG
ncbi:MAG: GNAT family N-acetyltransferase [Roseiarcus sp.]|jgi:putative acetyltransferase